MKKTSIFLLSLFLCLMTFAQKQTEKDAKSLLCHKWKFGYAKVGDERFPLPSDFRNTFLDIKSDGVVIAGNQNKQKKGKWRYNHKTKTFIVTTESDSLIFKLVKVDKTELIMNTTKEGITMTMYLKHA